MIFTLDILLELCHNQNTGAAEFSHGVPFDNSCSG